jgi:hypothetical protein
MLTVDDFYLLSPPRRRRPLFLQPAVSAPFAALSLSHVADRLGLTVPPELDGMAAVVAAWQPKRRASPFRRAPPLPPPPPPRPWWAMPHRRSKQQLQPPGPSVTPLAAPSTTSLSTYTRHLAAGAASCAVTRTVLAPLERIKLEQVLHAASGFRATAEGILRAEGVMGLWAGNAINLLRTCPHKALNFACFDAYRRALLAATGTPHFGAAERFGAGALAGMTATSLCFPLDVLRTRMMGPGAVAGAGVGATLRTILTVEGPSALYVGVWPALAATAPAGAVFYGTYDVVKEAYLRATCDALALPRPPRLAAAQTLAFGAAAGFCAELSIYPAEVVRRRMQLASMARARTVAAAVAAAAAGGPGAVAAARAAAAAAAPPATFRAAAAALMRDQGLKGFYAGLGANMLQVLPSAALSYYAYEVFKGVLAVE